MSLPADAGIIKRYEKLTPKEIRCRILKFLEETRVMTLAIKKLFELQSARIFRVKPERIFFLDKADLKGRVECLLEG